MPKAGGSITVSDASARRRRGKQRDDAAVGVPDEMVARPDDVLEPDGIVVEVDALDGRVRRESRPVRQHELEPRRELALPAPGQGGIGDAAVEEDEPGPCHEPNPIARPNRENRCHKRCYIPDR